MDNSALTTAIPVVGVIISVIAIMLSGVALYVSRNTSKSDRFATLYDELNAPSLGLAMERIGEWIDQCALEMGKPREQLTEADIRDQYRKHLRGVTVDQKITKRDDLESARRTVKAWFIKCCLFYEAGNLDRRQLGYLITDHHNELMWYSFFMTREQADWWKKQGHNPTSRSSSHEPFFKRLADAGFSPPANA